MQCNAMQCMNEIELRRQGKYYFIILLLLTLNVNSITNVTWYIEHIFTRVTNNTNALL